MFMQIHMLQSVPPGNLNRDEAGQPKKCIFGGVTRGRISSQCLKRNIRTSPLFKEAFGEHLAVRSKYLPALVAEALALIPGSPIPEAEWEDIKSALASEFNKKEKTRKGEPGETAENATGVTTDSDTTRQLVFFSPAFARKIAELLVALKNDSPEAYKEFIGATKKGEKLTKEKEKEAKKKIGVFIDQASNAKESLSVDVALFGRMTTSEIIADVEAACQVAHALSTHETLIESDYFTAMDDLRDKFTKGAGAAYLGSGDTETFFNSAVYYKYLNLDTEGLLANLGDSDQAKAARAAGALLGSAALATPTGKQNSFAAHSVPELILVELSARKQPISYANAFLLPVQAQDLMKGSAQALADYCDSIAKAFSPGDTRRFLLKVGSANGFLPPEGTTVVETLSELVAMVESAVKAAHEGKA